MRRRLPGTSHSDVVWAEAILRVRRRVSKAHPLIGALYDLDIALARIEGRRGTALLHSQQKSGYFGASSVL